MHMQIYTHMHINKHRHMHMHTHIHTHIHTLMYTCRHQGCTAHMRRDELRGKE